MTKKEMKRIETLGAIGLAMFAIGMIVALLVGSTITEPDTNVTMAVLISLVALLIAVIGGGIVWWLAERLYA